MGALMGRSAATRLTYPPPFRRLIIASALEAFLLQAVRVETGRTEANIPTRGPFVCVFAPHSGWIESLVIDACFNRVGRAWPVWLTKAENRSLPRVLAAGRLICIDQQDPAPGVVRTIDALLAQPDAVLATAIEGTRFGNPADAQDLSTLGAFKTGPVRFATRARVPILPVVVLGAERVVPHLDQVWQGQGSLVALRQIWQQIAHPQPIAVRFLPLYRGHLPGGGDLRGVRPAGKALREQAALHTARLRERFVAQIRALDPDYPLGAVDL